MLLSRYAALGVPWGDGSVAPQLCGCRTGAVTFKPSISTLSLPDLSVLTTRHKEKEQTSKRQKEVGTTELAQGEMDRVKDGCLMKEMNRWRRLNRQEMEREVKERRQSTPLVCHATATKSLADISVYVCVCECWDILLVRQCVFYAWSLLG